jgi:ferredoxin-type protein NapH
MEKKRGFIKVRTLRYITITILILVVLAGTVTTFACGNTCSLDLFGVSFTCPLGFLQTTLASRSFVPEAWVSVGLVVLASILLGRFFCAWLCPTPLLKAFFAANSKPKPGTPKLKSKGSASPPSEITEITQASGAGGLRDILANPYSSYAVLVGSLASSFFFGFPVFCLVCPVGLFFGSLFAVRRLFFSQMVTLELILFPVILLVEIFVLKSWCSRLCPLGALLRIIGSVNQRIFRPKVNIERCYQEKDVNCQVCKTVCPEGIDLGEEGASLSGCTNCLECWEKCPTKAIKWLPFAWRRDSNKSST